MVAAIEKGLGKKDVAGTFGVLVPTTNRYLRLRAGTKSLAPRKIPGRPSVKGAALVSGLLPQMREHADATIEEHHRLWEDSGGVPVSGATMSRAIERLGGTPKKSR